MISRKTTKNISTPSKQTMASLLSELLVEGSEIFLKCIFVLLDYLLRFIDSILWDGSAAPAADPHSSSRRRLENSNICTTTMTANVDAVKTVFIVGGGFAGLSVLKELQEKLQQNQSRHEPNKSTTIPEFKIVLIDTTEYFEYTPGVLRLFCDPTLFPTLSGKYQNNSHCYKFIQGEAKSISFNTKRQLMNASRD